MDCLFCKITKDLSNSKKIYEDQNVAVIMDINPICEGHLLIIPKKHYDTVFDMPSNELKYLIDIGQKISTLLMKKLNYTGTSLIFNYGSRQEIKHVHLHVIGTLNQENQRNIDEIYNIISGVENE